ncbi:MAG: CHRD domain-containing protein [Nocardioides sp.]
MTHTSIPLVPRTPALLLSACLMGAGTTAALNAPAATGAEQSVRTLQATLRPSGDPDGSGEAHFRLRRAAGKVCATVEWHGIEQPDSAHIHRRSTGAVVIDLGGSVTGGAHCATGVRPRLIGKILDHPRRFYFNVHNATYPAGAIQGVLHR